MKKNKEGIIMCIKKFTTGLLALTMVFGGAVMPMGAIAAETSLVASAATTYYNYNGYQYIVLADGTLEITAFDAVANGCKGKLEIPATIKGKKVTSIGKKAFHGCTAFTELHIPEGVKTICDFGFYQCSNVKKVVFPNSLTTISYCAFDNCKSLTAIDLPKNINKIGDFAFNGIEKVKSVFIPKSVVSIGENAFGYKYIGRFSGAPMDDFTVKGYKGSAAEKYASDNGFKFIAEAEETVEPTEHIKGDLNGDGKVNVTDITKLAAVIKGKAKLPEGVNADFNGDNKINISDLILLAAHIKGVRILK